jgi:hypothetical protein
MAAVDTLPETWSISASLQPSCVLGREKLKRVLLLSLAFGAFVLAPTPAAADVLPPGLPCTPVANGNGAASCTINAHPITLPFFAGPCAPAVSTTASIIGNAVFHVTQNTATDFWITETQQGTFVGLPVGWSGHATQWFGIESNSNNQVVHAISEGRVTSSTGTVYDFNETFHFSISASGQQNPVVFDKCNN